MKKRSKTIIFSLLIGVVLTLISLIHAERVYVPDLDQIVYGYPLPWLFHQTSSFAGPVDIWYVQWQLVLDFIFWCFISIVIVFLWVKYKINKNTIKKFLKPNWKKIVLTFIIIVFLISIIFIPYVPDPTRIKALEFFYLGFFGEKAAIKQCLLCDITEGYCITGIPEIIPLTNPDKYTGKYATSTSACCCIPLIHRIVYIFIYIIFFYTISSFIIWIYDKLVKK